MKGSPVKDSNLNSFLVKDEVNYNYQALQNDPQTLEQEYSSSPLDQIKDRMDKFEGRI